jgi:exodeoxyribonuclease I
LSQNSIYWYDFETFGVNPRRDRASQFAGIRTDEDLNIIGEPLMMYCKPANDFLPNPMACLITGISPQKAQQEGVSEAEFIRRIEREFSAPCTCVAGYNSIQFDDEVTRQLLYRNFYDPYEREWKNGNSRWDIIDTMRLCAAVRPEGINWPRNEFGNISFKLDQLSVANGIEHEDAHDALADVIATIEMAKLIKQHQPKLYQYAYGLRSKREVQKQLDMRSRSPVLHVSTMYSADRGRLALVMPIGQHPLNNNGVIVYDLRNNPAEWKDLPVEEIRRRIFTPREKLGEGERRIALSSIAINKCPLISPISVLDNERAADYAIDLDICRQHWQLIDQDYALTQKILQVFSEEPSVEESDPDFMIYSGGFFSDHDKDLMSMVRTVKPEDLSRIDLPFRDRRLHEMYFRYRARNFNEYLSEEELSRWQQFRIERLVDSDARQSFGKSLVEAKARAAEDSKGKTATTVLDDLENYVNELGESLSAS